MNPSATIWVVETDYESPLKGANIEDGETEDVGAEVMQYTAVNGCRLYSNSTCANPNMGTQPDMHGSGVSTNVKVVDDVCAPNVDLVLVFIPIEEDGEDAVKQPDMGVSVATNVATGIVPDNMLNRKGIMGCSMSKDKLQHVKNVAQTAANVKDAEPAVNMVKTGKEGLGKCPKRKAVLIHTDRPMDEQAAGITTNLAAKTSIKFYIELMSIL
ncbi:hypothetical protein Tco_0348893 [Tanacetum coccineum]